MEAGKVIVVGGGAAGLSAAYTLKKRGFAPVLLEANNRVGGRLGGDRVDGFLLDEGADFFTASHDVALRLCEELGLPLIRSMTTLGWYKNGRFSVTTPEQSLGGMIKDLPALWNLGLLSPRSILASIKLGRIIKDKQAYVTFASDSRVAEFDEEESASEYLNRIGVPDDMLLFLRGLLEMTMGDLDEMSAAFALTFMGQIMAKTDQLYVPEKGVGSLTYALADACGADIRVSTPARSVIILDGTVTGVIVDGGPIEADAVICATSATTALNIIPDLPDGIRRVLSKIRYARGCRVVIGLDHRPLPAGWNGVLYPEDETPLLLDRSINLPACVPPGKSTLDMLVGRDRAEELFPLDNEEIKRRMLADVRRHPPPPGSNLPGDDEGLFTRVYRWKEALCIGPPGILRAIAELRRQNSREVKNLFLAGDYMRMPSVNGALASGIDAANEAAELLSSRPSQEPSPRE